MGTAMVKDYILGAVVLLGLAASMAFSLWAWNPIPLLSWFAISVILITKAAAD